MKSVARIRRRYARAIAASSIAIVLVFGASAGRAGSGTPVSSCAQTVTTNAFLTQDLVCTFHGVVVGAADITIDLKGFTIRGDGDTGNYGIDDTAGFDGVTIKNGVVRNFELGIFANGVGGANGMRVSGLVAAGNVSHGILVVGSAASINSSTASGNDGYGIYVLGDGARVKSSGVFGNSQYGIRVEGAEAQVTSSAASGNEVGGIVVFGDASKLSGNRALGNGFAGGSDLSGPGILATAFTTPPVGKNVALGNDDPAECVPTSLC